MAAKKGSFARCVQKVSRKGVDDPNAVCAAAKRKAGEKLNRKNPEGLAARAFEATHGYPPDAMIEVTEQEHYHEYLPAWGELIELVIVPEGEEKGVRLMGFGEAFLTFSEHKDRPQLFITGGDQELSKDTLRLFGIEVIHEKEVLGKVVDITYYTIKTHLDPRDGGEANYNHKFAEESAGNKKHLRILESPTATYDTLNKTIHLWGGKYTNTPEGIRN